MTEISFWCLYHERIVTPEHFYRCWLLRPPPDPIHMHSPSPGCVKSVWASEAISLSISSSTSPF